MIFTVKTVVGREEVVLNAIAAKAKSENLDIRALAHPEEIKGYIFVEGEIKDIEAVAKTIPHIRGIIKRPIEVREIQRFLEPKKAEIELNKGDIVEIIGGPFKGEKGKVVRYESIKREVVVELLEVAVPIPVTVSVEFVKVVEKVK
ncbi:MAG: transcription elongation factor Spt5 [Candidatus Aenigmatarchaeota archaeon]